MKKILISIVMIVLIMLLAYIFKDIITVNSNASDDRFVLISNEGIFDIYYDKETKVQYSISRGSYNQGNLTVLVDAEGKPLLYQESKWWNMILEETQDKEDILIIMMINERDKQIELLETENADLKKLLIEVSQEKKHLEKIVKELKSKRNGGTNE